MSRKRFWGRLRLAGANGGLDDLDGGTIFQEIGIEDEVVEVGVVDILAEVLLEEFLTSGILGFDVCGGLALRHVVGLDHMADALLEGADEADMKGIGEGTGNDAGAATDNDAVAEPGETDDGVDGVFKKSP